MDQLSGCGSGGLAVVGESETSGCVSVQQSLSSADSHVSVKEVNKIQNEGEFAYKKWGLCKTLEKEREEDVQWGKLDSFKGLAGW